MSERVPDATLADIRRALETSPWPSVGGDMTTREALALVEELQQHRARIAEHAAAHPERLSDEAVARVVSDPIPTVSAAHAMAVEIQQRRAEDLTSDEVEAMRELLASLDNEPYAMRTALEKILRAHGVTP